MRLLQTELQKVKQTGAEKASREDEVKEAKERMSEFLKEVEREQEQEEGAGAGGAKGEAGLRGKAVDDVPNSKSCKAYGCHKYIQGNDCQCNDSCSDQQNCCPDFVPTCQAGAEAQHSCAAYGCVDFTPANACQCNANCMAYGNCCSDFASKCMAEYK